jgi:hypothetical protein
MGRRLGGLKGLAGWRFRRTRESSLRCSRGLSALRCGPRCKGSFPIFLNPSSYLNYDSNLN